ncbi:MAG: hypothetical protein ACOYIK_09095 [Coriobacteriales bacterium]
MRDISAFKRASTLLFAILVAFSVCGYSLALPQVASAEESTEITADTSSDSKRIFVLDAPYLEWDDISYETTPNLYSIIDDCGIGNLITRSMVRVGGKVVSADECAGSIACGRWIEDPSGLTSKPTRLNANGTEKTDEELEAEANGVLGSEKVTYGDGDLLDSTLGDLLVENDWATIALGCSDLGKTSERPAAALLASGNGVVEISDTQPDNLTVSSEESAYGMTTDMGALQVELQQALSQVDGNAIVALDSGDLYRAGTDRVKNPSSKADENWEKAVSSFDDLVGIALSYMGPNDTLVIYSTLSKVDEPDHQDDGYAPLFIYGSGYDGMLGSGTLGRDDLTCAIDITETILSIAGIDHPIENASVLYTTSSDKSGTSIISDLSYDANVADAVNDAQLMVQIFLAVLLVLTFGFSIAILAPKIKFSPNTLDKGIIITRLLWLVSSAFPVSTYLMMMFIPADITPVGIFLICIAVTFIMAFIALVVGRLTRWLYSLIFLMALTVIVIVVDQLTGGHLASIGFLTYMPVKMGRFTGIGNEGAGVLFSAWIMLSGLLLNRFPDLKISKMFRNWLFIVLSAFIIAVIVAPWWGCNFGVLVWGTVGVWTAWWMFIGRRLNWKVVLITMAICVGLTVLLVLVDGFSNTQSHLGATASNLVSMGIAYVPVIINNMLRLSIATLVYNPLISLSFAFVWIVLAVLRIKKPGPYEIFWKRNNYFKAAFTSAMIVAVLVLFIEDSGILLPALILIYSTGGLTWLICDLHRWEQRAVEMGLDPNAEPVEQPIGGFKINFTKLRNRMLSRRVSESEGERSMRIDEMTPESEAYEPTPDVESVRPGEMVTTDEAPDSPDAEQSQDRSGS